MKITKKILSLASVASLVVSFASINPLKAKGFDGLHFKRFVDLKVNDISLNKNDCTVKIQIANIGTRGLPPALWQNVFRVTPKILIKKDNRVVRVISLISIPNSKKLRFPGGSVTYQTNIKVPYKSKIKVFVDSNNIIREKNENNNKKVKVLTCDYCGLPPLSQRKPDLVIKSFALKKWGVCQPNNAVLYFQVRIKNIGNEPTPIINSKALIQVMDKDGSNWGNGKKVQPLEPGQSRLVTVPIYYLKSNPNHMKKNIVHRFRAVVNPLNLIDEKNEHNNKSAIIKVQTQGICH